MKALWYAKWAVKAVTPPILLLGLKWLLIALGLRKRERPVSDTAPRNEAVSEPLVSDTSLPEWEYVPEGWARPVKGWDVEAVADAYREKWPSFLRAIEAPRPLGVYHETAEVEAEDHAAHNMLVSFAYVLAAAARGRERLSVLDWGGALGHYCAVARSALPDLELDYHVKETPAVCVRGRELLPEVEFHEDDSCLDRRYDLVMASASLHYEPDWRSLVGRFADAAERHLYLARVPVAFDAGSFVVLQRAFAYGYETEYLGWVVNRGELLDAVPLPLAREFLHDARVSAAGAPDDPVGHRSFLFNR
jgi:putative methyltransferase (TIGR04325 family)